MDTQIQRNADGRKEQMPSFHLAQPIEFVAGLNDIPLLYLPAQKKYIRVSILGKSLLQLFQTTDVLAKEDVMAFLMQRFPQNKEAVVQKGEAFLAQLEQLGVLAAGNGATEYTLPPTLRTRRRLERVLLLVSKYAVLRLPLWRPDRVLADRLIARLRAGEGSQMAMLMLWFWLSFALLVAGFSIVRLGIFFDVEMIRWPLILLLFVCHLAGHECSHILVASYHRVKTRAVGVGLLYYCLPFLFVDRTDSYRLRSANASASIALAGPVFDLSATTITALLATFLTGWLKATFHLFFLTEALIFLSNSNPLMPGDGYQALEMFLGEINFRQRSFRTLFALLTRTPLPAHLQHQSWKRKMFSCLYSLLVPAWIGVMVWFTFIFFQGGFR